MFQIRLATPDDLELIIGMIDKAADWLRTKGTDQWARPWPSRPARDERVIRGLLAGSTWLVVDRGTPVATATSWQFPGHPDLWTDAELSEPAVYMSRLVLNRDYANTGAGAALTDWVGARGREERGALELRIDVWTNNYRLHGYYMSQGFSFLRTHPDEDYPSGALFSKPTEDIKVDSASIFWVIPALPAATIRLPLTSSSCVPQRRVGRWHMRRARRQVGARPFRLITTVIRVLLSITHLRG
jgi:ribosomal protein S18 acetylase RimI-like enzyme